MVRKRLSFDSFQRYQWSKNHGIWLDEMHTWQHFNKIGSLMCYLPLVIMSMQKNQRYQLVLFSDIADQRILQSDWTRDTSGYKQRKVARWLIPFKKSKILINSKISKKLMIQESCNLIGHNWPHSIKNGSLNNATFPWWLTPFIKNWNINCFFLRDNVDL